MPPKKASAAPTAPSQSITAGLCGEIQRAHQQRVDSVVRQLQARPEGKTVSIRKNTATHQIHDRPWKEKCHPIDVSDLCNVLGFVEGVDRMGEPCTLAVCEPQVQMLDLVRACAPHNLLPQVVPEYDSFTVAGLINGEGIQTSGFRYGVFTHTVAQIEIVLGNGNVVTCSATENTDLYIGLPESLGTLGIVTCALVALRPMLPWVRSEYTIYNDVEAFVHELSKMCQAQQGDFLEGLVLSRRQYVIIRSFFQAAPDGLPIFRPYPTESQHGERYYYQYIRDVVFAGGRVAVPKDVIPTTEFVFRSQRGLYWMVECYAGSSAFVSTPFLRRLADAKVKKALSTQGFAPSKNWTRAQMERCLVMQDMGVMQSRLKDGITFVQEKIGVYPLWVCPVSLRRNNRNQTNGGPPITNTFIYDVGIYGEPTIQPFRHWRIIPELEKFVDHPSVWGVCYHKTADEIRGQHDPLRKKYAALGVFPGLEDKILATKPKDARVNLDEGPIFAWRLVKDYGPYWPVKLLLLVGIVASVVYYLLLRFRGGV